MSEQDRIHLPAGTPVIMVETLIDCMERDTLFLAELPKLYAGRLVEPHPLTEGMTPALIVEGPCALSLAPGEFDTRAVLWSDEGETMMVFMANEGEEALRIRWVIEDLKGRVDAAETADFSSWAETEAVRQKLYRAVIEPFAFFIGNSFLELFFPTE